MSLNKGFAIANDDKLSEIRQEAKDIGASALVIYEETKPDIASATPFRHAHIVKNDKDLLSLVGFMRQAMSFPNVALTVSAVEFYEGEICPGIMNYALRSMQDAGVSIQP